MPDAFGNMSGPGNQQAWISVARTSQDQGGNYTTFRGGVRYYGNGWGSWGGDAGWEANFGGHRPSGRFGLTYEARYNTYTDLYWGYFSHGHDGNGYIGSFGCSCWIDTNHDSVGDGGASTTEEAAPRIPKRPSPTSGPSFSEITPTSVRVTWSWNGPDQGGSNIDGYLLRSWPGTPGDPGQTGGYTDHSQELNGSRVVTGLTPGETRTWAMYAHNGAADNNGYSNVSAAAALTMPSGVYVSDGSTWGPTQCLIGMFDDNGNSYWGSIQPQISDGTAWRAPNNVTV